MAGTDPRSAERRAPPNGADRGGAHRGHVAGNGAARVAGEEWATVEADVRPFLESGETMPALADTMDLLRPDR